MDPLNDAWPPKMEDADRALLADALRLAARAVASARLTQQTRWLKEFPYQEAEVSVTIRRGEIVYRWERGGDSREAMVKMGGSEEEEGEVAEEYPGLSSGETVSARDVGSGRLMCSRRLSLKTSSNGACDREAC